MIRFTPSSALVAAAVVCLVPACSGAVSTLGNGTGTGSSSGSSGSSSGGSSGSSSGGSSGGDAGTTVDSSGGGPIDTGVLDVVAVDTSPADVSTVPDVSTGGNNAVLCPSNGNPMTCTANQECCIQGDPMLGTQTDTCQSKGSPCVGGTTVHCAATADCPTGDVCCGTQTTTGTMTTYTEVSCAKTCTGTNQRIFCDPQANDCPQATPTCGQSQLLPGYNVCQ